MTRFFLPLAACGGANLYFDLFEEAERSDAQSICQTYGLKLAAPELKSELNAIKNIVGSKISII